MKKALEGIRIVDLSQYIVGPWATSLLADFGAEVIKIEKPGVGDELRHFDRIFGDKMSSYFVGMNCGKRSIELDLTSPAAIAVVKKLLSDADVFIANFRPGVLERLGLAYEQLSSDFPRLVYVSITGFGDQGPLADKPAMDIILQASGGLMGLTGEKGRPPVKIGAPVADFLGAYLVVSGVMMGLYVLQTQGIGQKIDIHMLDGQITCLANFLTGHAITGLPEGTQGGGHPQIVPYQIFSTSDSNIVVGCINQKFWIAFCDVIECQQFVADPRFSTNPQRVQNRDILVALISEILLKKPAKEWLALLEAKGIPCAEVSSLGQIIDSEQLRMNGAILNVQHPVLGPLTLIGNPLHLRATPPELGGPAPFLGEHTAEILRELGPENLEVPAVRGEANSKAHG